MDNATAEKVEFLKKSTDEFEALLTKYADKDWDAARALHILLPLFCEIRAGSIIPPYSAEYGSYEFGTEGSLSQYNDLCASEASFTAALGDWHSQSWYKWLVDG